MSSLIFSYLPIYYSVISKDYLPILIIRAISLGTILPAELLPIDQLVGASVIN